MARASLSRRHRTPPGEMPLFNWTENDSTGREDPFQHGKVFYNEYAPFPLVWLQELAAAGALPGGTFDGRSIEALQAEDVADADIAHFFAGIGVWSFAFEQAGWPRSGLRTWSASLPCQPWSQAGLKLGFDDRRHLWPVFFDLVRRCRPSVVVGEQVASPDGYACVDALLGDLEGAGYAVGAVGLCAAGFGSPQQRHRLYWWAARMADAAHIRSQLQRSRREESRRWEEQTGDRGASGAPSPTGGFWSDVEWLDCSDGSRRPTKPGLRTVADRTPGSVEHLRALGNALNAETAIGFVASLLDALASADRGH